MNYASIFLALTSTLPLFSMEDAALIAKKEASSKNQRLSTSKQIHFAQPASDEKPVSSSPRKEDLRKIKDIMPLTSNSPRVQTPFALKKETQSIPIAAPVAVDKPRISFSNSPEMMAAMIAAEAAAITAAASPVTERPSRRVSRTLLAHKDIPAQEEKACTSKPSDFISAEILKVDESPQELVQDQSIQEAKEALQKKDEDELHQKLLQARFIQEAKDALLKDNVNEFSQAVSAITDETQRVILLKGALLMNGENPLFVAAIKDLTSALKDEDAKKSVIF